MFTASQAQWSNAEEFLIQPSGGWIENEMKDQTKSGFKMTGAPEPVVSSNWKMPWEALHSTAGEAYIVPSQGKNVAGGKEFLRAMLFQGGRGELRQDEVGLDHRRQGHRACGRVRVDGTAIPDQDARGGRLEHLLVELLSSSMA